MFGSPAIGEAEIAEVVATLRSGWLGTGPRVQRFETDSRAYVGCAHAVALNSCTAGPDPDAVGLRRPGGGAGARPEEWQVSRSDWDEWA